MFYVTIDDIFVTILLAYIVFTTFFFFFKKVLTAKYYSLISAIFLSLLVVILLFLLKNLLYNSISYYFGTEGLFLNKYLINFYLSFALNPLTYSFVLLVCVIGLATNIYILNYFRGEADENTFVFWINAFIISMLFLVLAANFFTLFLGWELIGLTSFFLINFWQAKRSTLKSSFKAFSFNLVSDLFLLTAFVSFYYYSGTTDCETFFSLLRTSDGQLTQNISTGAVFLILCCAIKSVQFLGHLWLPDSMEAPVPASSLIHSATLVSAGIYLLCKFSVVFILLDWVFVMFFIGAFTAAYGAIVASAQTDVKKLLAYSTMSHCGFLWVLANIGSMGVVSLYLFLHGLFKASTFYCAGSFIRAYGTQDNRWMGNGATYYRGDTLLFVLSALNLAGLPFSLGILYKSLFFKMLLISNFSYVCLGLLVVGMLGSVVYFFRLIFYTCFDFLKSVKNLSVSSLLSNLNKLQPLNIVSANNIVAVTLLFFFSAVIVYYFYWFLNVNVLDFGLQTASSQPTSLFFLNLEKIYITYIILFYFLYILILLVLLLLFYRANSYAFQLSSITVIMLILIFF